MALTPYPAPAGTPSAPVNSITDQMLVDIATYLAGMAATISNGSNSAGIVNTLFKKTFDVIPSLTLVPSGSVLVDSFGFYVPLNKSGSDSVTTIGMSSGSTINKITLQSDSQTLPGSNIVVYFFSDAITPLVRGDAPSGVYSNWLGKVIYIARLSVSSSIGNALGQSEILANQLTTTNEIIPLFSSIAQALPLPSYTPNIYCLIVNSSGFTPAAPLNLNLTISYTTLL